MSTFGQNVQAARKKKKKKMTQVELAKAAGVNQSMISALESGAIAGCQVQHAAAIAKALGVKLDNLLS